MKDQNLNQLLDELLEIGILDVLGTELSPSTEERKQEVAQLVSRNTMPDDLKTLLARAHGAYVSSISLFTLDELEDVNGEQDYLFTYIPSAVFFASDGGDGFFFVDTGPSLGHGEGAVFWVYRGKVVPSQCVPCGESITAFLQSLAQNQEVWKGSSLEERAISSMLQTLEAHRKQWDGQNVAKLMEIIKVSDRYNIRIPKVLEKLLRRSNGIVFTKPGITLWDTSKIHPVEGEFSNGNRPLALLMGEDQASHRYAITHRVKPQDVPQGWPYLEGHAVKLTSGQPLEQAESMGYLPDLVASWLG